MDNVAALPRPAMGTSSVAATVLFTRRRRRVESARGLSRLMEAIRALAQAETGEVLLAEACRELTSLLDAAACSISRLDGGLLLTAAEFGFPMPQAEREYTYLLSDYPVSVGVIHSGTPRAVSLSDAEADASEAWVLRDIGMHSVLMLQLAVDARPWGLVEVFHSCPRGFDPYEIDLAELVVGQASGLLARFEHAAAQERLYRETLASLSNALEAKDGCTSSHTQEVAELASQVGRQFGFAGDEARTLQLAALLHDIGKLRVPEPILHKPGPLTDEEWAIMRTHPAVGERILEPITSLRDVLPVVRSHQEHWDGQGYPDGLVGAAIPLGARIVAVCDAYRAMIEERPYRRGLDPAAALATLKARSGTQFDPACVDALEHVLLGYDRAREAVLLRPR